MKLLLLTDAGHPVARCDDVQRYVAGNPAQLTALLDLVEMLVETAKQNPGEARPPASEFGTEPTLLGQG